MTPFQVLKNMYISLLIYLMYENTEGLFTKFWMVRWAANIICTLLLPLLVPVIILKLIKKIISTKDAEEATKAAQERLAIHEALSFYEWRNNMEVYFRVMKRHSSVKEVYENEKIIVRSVDIDVTPSGVLATLILTNNQLCKMRLETKEEYVARLLFNKFGPNPPDRKMDLKHAFRKQRITPTLEEQFDIIEKVSGSDIFKSFWLGRQLVFKKKATGISRKNPPNESPLPNAG